MKFLKYILLLLFVTSSVIASSSDIVKTTTPPLLTSSGIPNIVPTPPDFPVKGFILIDANSGNVLAEKNADTHLPPASLTKIMTLYLTAQALKDGKIHFDDQVRISENAWHKGGSRMFIKVGSTVPVKELIDGIVIASGNDATVAMAEYLAGTEDTFANLMNQTAASLGMRDTHYVDSNGLPEPNHYSTSRDIATLAKEWILTFPEYYPWFKQQWIEYNGIKQPNRNRLLWHDSSVDGMKTGHTDDAGYCLVASALRNNMRLIAVIMGATSEKLRLDDAEGLLNYGFRFFESHKLYNAGVTLVKPRMWYGKENAIALGVKRDFYVTVPVGQYKNLKAKLDINQDLQAPIVKEQECGKLNITLDGKIISSAPLVALQDNPRAGVFSRSWDRLVRLFNR